MAELAAALYKHSFVTREANEGRGEVWSGVRGAGVRVGPQHHTHWCGRTTKSFHMIVYTDIGLATISCHARSHIGTHSVSHRYNIGLSVSC